MTADWLLRAEGEYPEAIAWLARADELKSEIATLWAKALDAGLLIHGCSVDDTGAGAIEITACWDRSGQLRLTELMNDWVEAIWSCLDCLVAETAFNFSVNKRMRNPERQRFWPVAPDAGSFDLLLSQSCMDGILRPHYELVRSFQPFATIGADTWIGDVRGALNQLTEWENALEQGVLMGAWASPAAPSIFPSTRFAIVDFRVAAPGRLDPVLRVATFRVEDWVPGTDVYGETGSYVDLGLLGGFRPENAEDTFESRMQDVVVAVRMILVAFADISAGMPGPRRIRMAETQEVLWWPAAESRWSNEALEEVQRHNLGLATHSDGSQSMLLSTPNGVFERALPVASSLRNHARAGMAAENAARDAVATWGLPDFIFPPQLERKGSGVREVSDGLLIVGKRGLVLQLKTREGEPAGAERESNWLTKSIAKAASQVDGTVRSLRRSTKTLRNGRGLEVAIDGAQIEWCGVIMIEHPSPPSDFRVPDIAGAVDVVVLLRRDWEFLFAQLKSASAVVDYVFRVKESAGRLGEEPLRYFDLARLDGIAKDVIPSRPLPAGAHHAPLPLLPQEPTGTSDPEALGLFEAVLEDLAAIDDPNVSPTDQLMLLALLDALPVGYREGLGRFLIDELREIGPANPEVIRWKARTFIGAEEEDRLAFLVCSVPGIEAQGILSNWAMLRHHDRGLDDSSPAKTTAIMLTPRSDGLRDWDTSIAAVSGPSMLNPDDAARLRRLWSRGVLKNPHTR